MANILLCVFFLVVLHGDTMLSLAKKVDADLGQGTFSELMHVTTLEQAKDFLEKGKLKK